MRNWKCRWLDAKRAIDAGKIIKKSREYFLVEGEKADKKP
jgi:hypothetical protein